MTSTLDPRSLQWQEGWFKVSDGSKALATEGPYIMKKTLKIQKPKNNSPKLELSVNSPELFSTSGNVLGRQANGDPLKNQVPVSDGVAANLQVGVWNLESFDDITNKLTSGSTVYMVVDATQCSKSGHAVPDRFNFGMEIDNFEISLDKRKFHGDLLKVSSLKKVLHENDVYDILREIHVYRDGTVVIDLYVMDHFSNHVTQQSMAVCRIYNSRTKDGQIKFTSDPFRYVKTIKSFGALRSALQKGQETKMVVDLNKCSHLLDKTTIIGGKIKDYDFLDSSDSIAATFTMLQSNANTENIITSENAFALFENNNRMTITLKSQNISKNNSEFLLNKTLKHRCIIGKDSLKNGLSLFHL